MHRRLSAAAQTTHLGCDTAVHMLLKCDVLGLERPDVDVLLEGLFARIKGKPDADDPEKTKAAWSGLFSVSRWTEKLAAS